MLVTGLINLLILALVLCLIFGLLVLLVRRAPFIPDPYRSWVEWCLIAIGVLVFVVHALQFVGVRI